MHYFEAAALALVQALTEFLPVSSSGHLVLAQHLFGHSAEIDILYDVLLHVATTAAVLTYLRRDVAGLFRVLVGLPAVPGSPFSGHERRTLAYVLVANVPTGIIGLGIERLLVQYVTRPDIVGAMLIVTGFILWGEQTRIRERKIDEMRLGDAVGVGVFQGLAVLPGISRSGATIIGGILLGLERDLAARFSLLISVPAIAGAALLELSKVKDLGAVPLGPYLAGMAVAAAAGYLAIAIILRLVRQRRFHLFAFYVWPLGVLAILWQHAG
jgi:undecaprenyl-diphosphatase